MDLVKITHLRRYLGCSKRAGHLDANGPQRLSNLVCDNLGRLKDERDCLARQDSKFRLGTRLADTICSQPMGGVAAAENDSSA